MDEMIPLSVILLAELRLIEPPGFPFKPFAPVLMEPVKSIDPS